MRTQSLRGGILGDAPFHWDGSLTTFGDVAHETMPQRMHSSVPEDNGIMALARWVNTIPRGAASAGGDPTSIARGQALFHDATVACASCHVGARLSDHALLDVGTGGTFKVPSLAGVGMRGPWMHDGCARTLAQRFDAACGGGDRHGHTSQLTTGQIADLVAYLQSL
jgi:mono/diheme cytochrome c family protein